MDFLDPKKKRLKKIQLIVGYFLMGILLILATVILLYQAYGFGLNKNGHVYQNGLVFISSTPGSANIYVSGVQKGTTDTQLILPSGQYLLQLKRTGYRTWSRAFNVDGSSVQHFDYPFLVPTNLATKNTTTYSAVPSLVLQSPDRRWLLVEQPGTLGTFDEFDLNNPTLPSVTVSIPANVLTPVTTGAQSLSLVQWSDDNQHIILAHNMPTGIEYVMFDRQTPANSVNLNTALEVSPTTIEFFDGIYNQYYVYTDKDHTLSTISIQKPKLTTVLTNVLADKTYGSNIILYATNSGAPSGETAIRLLDSGTTYNIRTVAAGSQYLLNLAYYNGGWVVGVGASAENKIYIYQNPQQALQSLPGQPLVPVSILKVTQPNYLYFSSDTRMLLAENGTQFAVYDGFKDTTYSYTLNTPLDPPQVHAVWMNGEELTLVSGGKVIMFDFDDANQQTLETANPTVGVYFDRDYKYIYGIAPNTNSATSADPYALTSTALRTPADL